MPGETSPQATGGSTATGDDSSGVFQLNAMVPTFDPAVDDVHVWSGKVELLLTVWPKTRITELATRLILGCKGSVFMKLQLHRDAICINDPKGIRKLVELVGGSWGQIPLEKKFELAEKALYKCIQKSDESSDSYLTRCDVVWTELLARNMKLGELQAYIMLRGSRLSAEDKKRVLVDSGAESGGNLEMDKVTAAVRMLGAGFFQEMTGNRKDKSLKVYDTNAFVMDDVEDMGENDTFMVTEDGWDDDYVDSLAAEHDDDASLVVQFEDAVMETIANDQELSTFFSTYQDARRRLAEKNRVRGFWPVRKSGEKGKKGGKGKSKGKGQSLASRIANSYCRICFKRGHWKDECPNNPKSMSSGSTGFNSAAPSVAPTSFVTASDMPSEIAHLPFEFSAPKPDLIIAEAYFGYGSKPEKPQGKNDRPVEVFNRFALNLKHRLRQTRTPERMTIDSKPRKYEFDCQSPQETQPLKTTEEVEQHHSYFASSGTVGVVDLGASQTVIGSQQIPELLQKLPAGVKDRVKRTDCNLVFRFGNHQTLNSKHALLLPVLDSWFRIAIVNGNTPFLLSSEFLRKTLKAVIDTEQGTIWSKTLNRSLDVDVNSKNLFLMDISQLWSDTKGCAQPVLASQVQSAEALNHAFSGEKLNAPGLSFQSASSAGEPTPSVSPKDCCIDKSKEIPSLIVKETPPLMKTVSKVKCGPSQIDRDHSSPRDLPVTNGERVATSEELLPRRPEGPGGERAGSHSMDVTERSETRKDCFWEGQEGNALHRSISGSLVDGLVCSKLRDLPEASSSQICEVCGADPERRDGQRREGQEEVTTFSDGTQGKDDCSQIKGQRDFEQDRRDRFLDTGGSCRFRARSGLCGGSPRGGSVHHESRESTSECPAVRLGTGHARSDLTPEAIPGKARALGHHNGPVDCPGQSQSTEHTEIDEDFEFLTEHSFQSFDKQVRKLIKKLELELSQVIDQEALFPKRMSRLDMLEVMCSERSEITGQTLHLGGKASRFGLSEGNLQEESSRRKLFQTMVRQKPQNLWYSPICAPWCAWSRFNCQRSLETSEKIMNDRWDNLWQLALAVVMFRFQSCSGRHFHLEQPFGSSMLLVPCVHEIIQHSSKCCFDMCRLGSLSNPITLQPIRKRLVVLTTSRALHQFLDGKLCDRDHFHQHIAGSIRTTEGIKPLSQYTENYPRKFARQVVKVLLNEKVWEQPLYAVEEETHPTKRRRLGTKMSPSEIAQKFPSVNWSTALRLADSAAPRVGLKVIEEGQLIDVIQALCPLHCIKHIVLCRGTDRYIGPSKTMHPGEAPLRKRACIRRRFEDIQIDEEWEPGNGYHKGDFGERE